MFDIFFTHCLLD